MQLTVNGEPREVPDDTTVADLMAGLSAGTRGTAVAVDGSVVPRADWAGHVLAAGVSVEMVHAVQGG